MTQYQEENVFIGLAIVGIVGALLVLTYCTPQPALAAMCCQQIGGMTSASLVVSHDQDMG